MSTSLAAVSVAVEFRLFTQPITAPLRLGIDKDALLPITKHDEKKVCIHAEALIFAFLAHTVQTRHVVSFILIGLIDAGADATQAQRSAGAVQVSIGHIARFLL